MDCMVIVSGGTSGRSVDISGGAAVRFKAAIEKEINDTLDALGANEPLKVSVRDNGARSVVLGARVEAAYNRYRRLPA
jgi:citrate lyase acyl carrier protein